MVNVWKSEKAVVCEKLKETLCNNIRGEECEFDNFEKDFLVFFFFLSFGRGLAIVM